MRTDDVRKILEKVEFRTWRFAVKPTDMADTLQVVFFDRSGNQQRGRKWYVSWHATSSEIVQTALLAVLTALEHEAREDFKYDGHAIFGPHFDVGALRELAAEKATDVRAAAGTQAGLVHG